jgi:hypothetical protein
MYTSTLLQYYLQVPVSHEALGHEPQSPGSPSIYQDLWFELTYGPFASRSFTLENYTLGAPRGSYGPNIRVVAILVPIALLFSWLAFAVARDLRDRTAWIVFYVLAGGFLVLIGHYLSSRVWVHELGLSFRGILGYGEIRWDEVERTYFGSYKIHAHHIPLGTFYRLKLRSANGQKISLGERIRGADQLAQQIAKFTFDRLLQQASQQFDVGTQIDFGAIRVSRTGGVTLKKWFRNKTMRWDEIAGYETTANHMTFHRLGSLFSRRVAAERIANMHVLRALLNTVLEAQSKGFGSDNRRAAFRFGLKLRRFMTSLRSQGKQQPSP